MSTAWAIQLDPRHAAAAAMLRLQPHVEVLALGNAIWLRGPQLDDDLQRELSKLPATARYRVSSEGRLTPLGALVPKGSLPAGTWSPLAEWIIPQPQPAALSGELTQRVPLRLVRSDEVSEPSVLRCRMEPWCAYASSAPQIRLNPLRFAMSTGGEVIIRGCPLPPIPGDRYVEAEGVAVPCGFAVTPSVGPTVVRKALRLSDGDLAVLDPDGSYEHIDAGSFVRASRAAARLSLEATRHA